MLIIREILSCEELSEKDNLARMHREVLHHMGDRFQHRDVVALIDDTFGEAATGKLANGSDCVGNPSFQ